MDAGGRGARLSDSREQVTRKQHTHCKPLSGSKAARAPGRSLLSVAWPRADRLPHTFPRCPGHVMQRPAGRGCLCGMFPSGAAHTHHGSGESAGRAGTPRPGPVLRTRSPLSPSATTVSRDGGARVPAARHAVTGSLRPDRLPRAPHPRTEAAGRQICLAARCGPHNSCRWAKHTRVISFGTERNDWAAQLPWPGPAVRREPRLESWFRVADLAPLALAPLCGRFAVCVSWLGVLLSSPLDPRRAFRKDVGSFEGRLR